MGAQDKKKPWKVHRLTFKHLSNTIQDHPPRWGTTHNDLGPLTTNISLKNAPTDLPVGRSNEVIP